MRRCVLVIGCVLAICVDRDGTSSVRLQAQSLALKPAAPQRVLVEPGPPALVVAPGGAATLWADVTPKANLRIYAAGAKEFTPVALTLTPNPAVVPGRATYPPAELSTPVGTEAPAPQYRKTFRINQPVTLAKTARSGDTITITGMVTYQACDDRICYPEASAPVMWMVAVK